MIRQSLALRIAAILIATFLISGLGFGYLYHQHERKGLEQLMLKQAQLLFSQIIQTRHWNAGYGGVYVLKKPGMETNPNLYKIGPKNGKQADLRPEITDTEGNVYTLKNPSMMTQEVVKEDDVRFHLTSLKLVDPDNRPDGFETAALKRFEAGSKESYQVIDGDEGTFFRYMAPLKVEKSCLNCHGFQGYKLGDIAGGLSLELSMKDPIQLMRSNRLTTIVVGVSLLSIMIVMLWFALRFLVIRPIQRLEGFSHSIGSLEETDVDDVPLRSDEIGDLFRALVVTKEEVERHQHQLEAMAGALDEDRRHDPLTGLHNRRHLYLEGPQLFDMAKRLGHMVSVLMVDIDLFKEVNDTYGHATGDKVLIEMARKLMEHSRSYDLLIRYGGEEFAFVILNCDREQSMQIAHRIRREVGKIVIRTETGEEFSVTCSVGVVTGRNKELEQMLLRADEAMYRAKTAGRNRVFHTDLPS